MASKQVKEILMDEKILYIAPERSDALTHLVLWAHDRDARVSGRYVPFCGRDYGSDKWRLKFGDNPNLKRLCSDCVKELDRAIAAAKHLMPRKAGR